MERGQVSEAVAKSYRLGDATITRIAELALEAVDPSVMLPGCDPQIVAAEGPKLGAASFDSATGRLRQSIHTWLIRTPRHVVLIDTATGNDKERPSVPILHQLNEPFLDRLRRAGVMPEEVDFVLLTHVHTDHVGWNTRKEDGRWIPTFPNARYIFSRRERAYLARRAAGDEAGVEAICREAALGSQARAPELGPFDDSILPIIDAGLAHEITVDGSEVIEGFRFHPSAGHSIDHASIEFVSGGEHALFWGDVMHHPLQVAHPEWNSVFCEFPQAARNARQWAMEHALKTQALVFTTHFADTSAGRIDRDGGRFAWRFV